MTAAFGALPLQTYLTAQESVLRTMAADLQDAQGELLRRLNTLAARNGGLGAQVRAAQLAQIHRQLVVVQNELWKQMGADIKNGGPVVADAASLSQATMDRVLWGSAGLPLPDEIIKAEEAYARQVVRTYWSRMENGISLSQQVYKTQALSQGWVDRAINRVILQGGSWRDIADTAKKYIDPNVKGGVSYAAKRLGRTELNNAFHRTQISLGEANPWVTGQKWNLSGRHPRTDECDRMAKSVHEKGSPAGVYPAARTPSKPHPQCLCYLTQVTVSEDEFFDKLMKGDYEDASERFTLNTATLRAA